MASIRSLQYKTADEVIDSVRIDFSSFQSHGDIDSASLLKVIQRINYELGLRAYQPKETMLEINHGRAALPADFHQMLIALSCYNYTHVQNAPWNGNVKLEEICQTGSPQPSTCPCWSVNNVTDRPIQDKYIDCATIEHGIVFNPGITNICASSVFPIPGELIITTSSFCYPGTNGVYSCNPPDTCNICNVTHNGPCPELVVNPYPLGQCRTICQGTGQQATIKILQYCSSEVFCYETFDRLWIVPNIQADGFSTVTRPFTGTRNTGSINGRFLETHQQNCSKVYIQYLSTMEDDLGNLLCLDHPVILSYYSYALKERILENLYLNGEPDLERRLKWTQEKKEFYRNDALNIANTPDWRDVLNSNMVFKSNNDRQHYNTLSRYFGYLSDGGWSSGIDPYPVK